MSKNSCSKKKIPTQPNSSSVGKQNSCRNCGTTVTPVWRRSPTGGLLCNACGLYLKLRNTHRKISKSPNNKGVPPIEDIESCASLIDDTSSNDPDGSDKEAATGTCPGNGFCNGAGGRSSCVGCPVLNNRLLRGATKPQSSQRDKSSASANAPGSGRHASHDNAEAQESVSESTCHNCKTSITSMWRRDNNGYRICNPCGLFYKYHGYHKSKSAQHKSTIRRRRRVAPATPPADDDAQSVVEVLQPEPSPPPIIEDPAKNAFPSIVTAPFPRKKLMTIEPEPGIYSSIPFTSSIFPNFGDHQKPLPAHTLPRLHDRNSIALGSSHRALVYPPPPRPSIT